MQRKKKWNWTTYLNYTHTKKSELIKNLNVRPEAIKIIEESTGSNFSNSGYSNIFLYVSPKARGLKAKMKFGATLK